MKEKKKVHSYKLLHLSFSNRLCYKYSNGRRGLSANDQRFVINGISTPYKHHPSSVHETKNKKARPRAQLTEEHAELLSLPLIDERSTDVTKVVFPNGRVNYVLLARRNSICPRLQALHECISQRRDELDGLLSALERNRTLKDELGGGRYIASGYGNMGRNVHHSIRPPDQPALRQSLKFREHHELAEIVGDIFSRVSGCIATHCREVYDENQQIMDTNPKLAWPPLEYQKSSEQWMSTQFIVRRWGPGLNTAKQPTEESIVAAHTDSGDHDCGMFHCYITGGGKDGRGGPVAGTDVAIFEHAEGGACYRLKSCMEDTVVVVVLKSHTQLHGCIKNSISFVEDESAWSTRIIPFIPKGVWDWMKRHRTESPFSRIP